MKKIFVLLTALIFESVTSFVSQNCYDDGEICISEDCIKISYHLLKNMNLSVDPCDDFYQVYSILKLALGSIGSREI
jgi:hypothetical protein